MYGFDFNLAQATVGILEGIVQHYYKHRVGLKRTHKLYRQLMKEGASAALEATTNRHYSSEECPKVHFVEKKHYNADQLFCFAKPEEQGVENNKKYYRMLYMYLVCLHQQLTTTPINDLIYHFMRRDRR